MHLKEGCAVGIFCGPVGTLFKMELSKLNFNDIQGKKNETDGASVAHS